MKTWLYLCVLMIAVSCGKEVKKELIPADPIIGVWTTGWYEVPVTATVNGLHREEYEFYPDGRVRYEWEYKSLQNQNIRFYGYKMEGTYKVPALQNHAHSDLRPLDIVKTTESIRYFRFLYEANKRGSYGRTNWEEGKWQEITGREASGNVREDLKVSKNVIRFKDGAIYLGRTQALFFRDEVRDREESVIVERPFKKQ